MAGEGPGGSPRWERLDRADSSSVFRDRETRSTLTYIRRESSEALSSHEHIWILLSKGLELLATFECSTGSEVPPCEMAELVVDDPSLDFDDEGEGASAVDFSEIYSLPVKA